MDKDSTAYLTDIKKYEDMLSKDPDALCFAPLSDMYRKMGRIDDALEVALRGCEAHPEFIGGYMALGRACYEKGLYLESRQALERVVDAMPGNLLAQRLLSEVCRALGDREAAAESEAALHILAGEADRGPSLTAKEMMSPLSAGVVAADPAWGDFGEEPPPVGLAEEYVLEDDEIIELTDIVWDEHETDTAGFGLSDENETDDAAKGNPLSTVTIAELYVSQGFTERALIIYEDILETDPGNEDVQQRVNTLRRTLEQERVAGNGASRMEWPEGELATDEAQSSDRAWEPPPEEPVGFMSAVSAEGVIEPMQNVAPDQARVLETLEGWLENIRRRR